ncbi:MarR family transcriptional regulator [Streptomyces sp. NPDC005373]|jgi:DNA-binding MarR family transcriptional regulator|uniref:MarR family winged helix-turn-helix transcriptional regulator n=1 Tax=Streptomyces sp. NPDC005373 TaxID=3156879 RepID=UPI0033BF3D91
MTTTTSGSVDGAKHEHAIRREDLTRLRMTLGRLGRVLRQQNDDGLSYTLISLLFNIARNQPVSAGELATSEGVTPPSVTRSLNRLIELGFVSRTPDPADRRAALIELTPSGVHERERVLKSREAWLEEHLERLDDKGLESLLNALPALERLCDPELPHRS